MDRGGEHHVKQNQPDSERHISHFCSYTESRLKKSKQNKNKDMNIKEGLCFGG
jgi:hypothetical protein